MKRVYTLPHSVPLVGARNGSQIDGIPAELRTYVEPYTVRDGRLYAVRIDRECNNDGAPVAHVTLETSYDDRGACVVLGLLVDIGRPYLLGRVTLSHLRGGWWVAGVANVGSRSTPRWVLGPPQAYGAPQVWHRPWDFDDITTLCGLHVDRGSSLVTQGPLPGPECPRCLELSR